MIRRQPEFFYNKRGYPVALRFTNFKTDLFSKGNTPAINVNTAVTTGVTVSGATTTGMLVSGASTTGVSVTGVCSGSGVSVSSASAVGVSLSGAFTTAAIDITATAGRGIRIGTKGKTTDGSLPITATLPFDTDPANNYLLGVFTKIATTAVAATDDLGSAWLRTRVNAGMATNASWSLWGARSQLRIYASSGLATTISNWAAAGVMGVLEVSGATTTFASGAVAAAGYFNVALTTTSVIASGAVVAGVVINTNSAAITNTGTAYFGLYIQNYTSAAVVFDAAIKIVAGSCTNGISIASSAAPLACTAVTSKGMSIYTTCNTTNGSTNFEPVLFNTVMTGAGQVGGRVRVHMETNVVLGGWANAFKASVDLKAAGGCTGLLSAGCFELTAAAKANATTLAVLELELVTVASATFDGRHSLLYTNISGNSTANTSFLTNGVLWRLDGLGSASSAAKIFHTTGTVSATHGLRISIADVMYDILLKESTYA